MEKNIFEKKKAQLSGMKNKTAQNIRDCLNALFLKPDQTAKIIKITAKISEIMYRDAEPLYPRRKFSSVIRNECQVGLGTQNP